MGFILLKFLLQYSLVSPEYDLQRDEYLHLAQAHHLAWGYLSVPPFTSWISYLVYLLGDSVFWVRFFPALFGALTIVVVWKTIEALQGNIFSLILGAACVLFSALLRLNVLYQPNSFDVLSWTIFYYIAIRYFSSQKSKWLFIGAVFFAAGFLNKYNILFLIMGLLPAVLLTQQRKVFLQPAFYLALCVAVLLVSPNLLWQYNNHFPVIHHLKELTDTQLVHVNRIHFLASQLLFYAGAVVVIFAALYALLYYPPFKQYRPLFWSFVFTLAAFMYFRAKDYYAIGIYPVYISLGAVFLGNRLQNGWKKYLRPVLVALPLLLFIPLYKVGFPNKSPDDIVAHQRTYKKFGLLRWEDGKEHSLPQDFADMLGWKALAAKVDSICERLPDIEHTLILCDNYGQAGAINYYTKNKKIIARSFDADYINWLVYDKNIVDVVLVKEKNDEDKERKTEIPLFDTVYLAGQRINQFAREDSISIYVLLGAKTDINQRIKAEANKKKFWW